MLLTAKPLPRGCAESQLGCGSCAAARWLDRVVPIAVEAAGAQVNLRHLLVADLTALRVLARVDFGADTQTCLGGGRGDQVDDGHEAGQGPAPPVGADVREQAVFRTPKDRHNP